MSRSETDVFIAVEFSQEEWVALLTAAFYGIAAAERQIGGNVACIAQQSLAYTLADLGIHNLTDEARDLETKQRSAN